VLSKTIMEIEGQQVNFIIQHDYASVGAADLMNLDEEITTAKIMKALCARLGAGGLANYLEIIGRGRLRAKLILQVYRSDTDSYTRRDIQTTVFNLSVTHNIKFLASIITTLIEELNNLPEETNGPR